MRKSILAVMLALCAALSACGRADAPTAPAAPPKPDSDLLGDLFGGLLGWITNPTLRSQQFTTSSSVTASAHGGGKATAAGGIYHFSFAAMRKSNGTKGHAMLRIGSTRYDADVTCLGVHGDTAVIVGVVESSSDAGAVGDTMLFTAIDNGGDRIGMPEFPAAGQAGPRCASVTPGTTLAVDAGQVMVSGSTFTGTVVAGTVVGSGAYKLSGITNSFQTNITRASDGTVSGQYFQQDIDVTGDTYILTVSCLTLNGDTAYIGGTITSGTSSIGMEAGVIVVDNAPTTNPDQSSGIQFGNAQSFCNGAVSATLNNLTQGNIAITP